MHSRLNEEKSKAEGYSALHQDLLEKVKYLTEHNHHLQAEVVESKQISHLLLLNGNLKTERDDALHRIEIMKANLGNYSNELIVVSTHREPAQLLGIARRERPKSSRRAGCTTSSPRSLRQSTTGG